MKIRKIFRNIKQFLIISCLAVAGVKGMEYYPSLKNIIQEQRTSPVKEIPATAPYPEDPELKGMMPVDRQGRPSRLLYRKSYMVSYNRNDKIPNWVFWKLTREHADGNVGRPDFAFHEDTDVATPRATLADYRGSGYDRGHMCPAGDNKWDADAMYESFLLTNICPQNQNLNSGLWNQIEMSCRYWAKKYGSLYIVTGPLLLNRSHETIGQGKVVVPEAFFKVVLCLEGNPKGIAFICRNTDADRKKDYYVNTISQVERVTGYTFFPALSRSLAEKVKNDANISRW